VDQVGGLQVKAPFQKVVRGFHQLLQRRAQLVGRTVLHEGRRVGRPGLAYRAWFDEPGRLERLSGPVASFAWALEASAVLVAGGVETPGAHFLLSPLTQAEVAAFRQRFSPSREQLTAAELPPGPLSWLYRSSP
jgi:hypothetical protein